MHIKNSLALLFLCTFVLTGTANGAKLHLKAGPSLKWYKGQTHTHTLWSDGDAAPDYIVNWYKEMGYNFISITDHNTMLRGVRWVPVGFEHKTSEIRLKELQEKFGTDWVETRDVNGQKEMRLKTMVELKERFDQKGVFELVWGEEITSRNPQVHVNGINVRKKVQPAFGNYKDQGIRGNIDKVNEQSKELDIPMFAHLDHPNWNQTVNAEDILSAGNVQFFELYNGHAGVRNWGDEDNLIVSTDRLWDIMLSTRLAEGKSLVYGVGTDDAHNYFELRVGKDNPFRGWCMVLAPKLTSDELVNAYLEGNFYATTGVLLSEVKGTKKKLSISIDAQAGVTYTTQFIGTMKGTDMSSEPRKDADGNENRAATRIYDEGVGEVLFETTENPAVYRLTGNELYVRAKIVSDLIQDNPHRKGDTETAWIQPYIVD